MSTIACLRTSSFLRHNGCRAGATQQHQRSAIDAYARKNNCTITEWFEEQETAAKRGRPVFIQMLALLRQGKAKGVIIHKIDRSARNLRDWADINELIDAGMEIHLAHENLDLHSRGGRLSADIQAVVAADFIRNLRDEVRKGIQGRLNQGLYPLPAPLGYQNNGKGQAKTVDPLTALFVQKAFELYATGRYTLHTLGAERYRLGLRNRNGKRLTKNALSTLLNHELYIGIIRIRINGARYQGIHEPLITKSLFDRVQLLLKGKARSKGWKHAFLYRQSFRCRHCRRMLIGERQKGHVYYRCHTTTCPRMTLREDRMSVQVRETLAKLDIDRAHLMLLTAHLQAHKGNAEDMRKSETQTITLNLAQIDERMNRLTDAYLDQAIDRETFETRKHGLFNERMALKERLEKTAHGEPSRAAQLHQKLELVKTLLQSDSPANAAESAALLHTMTSNLGVDGKYLVVDWQKPFDALVAREEYQYGAPPRANARTVEMCLSDKYTNSQTDSELARQSHNRKDESNTPHRGWVHEWCAELWKRLME